MHLDREVAPPCDLSGHLLSDLGAARWASTDITVKIAKDFKGGVIVQPTACSATSCKRSRALDCRRRRSPISSSAASASRRERIGRWPLASLGVTNNSTVMLVRRTERRDRGGARDGGAGGAARRLADVEAAASCSRNARAGSATTSSRSPTRTAGRSRCPPSTASRSPWPTCSTPRAARSSTTRRRPSRRPAQPRRRRRRRRRSAAALSEALHYLEEGERALALCDRKWLALGDNAALLHLDCAWAALLHHAHGGGGGGAGWW